MNTAARGSLGAALFAFALMAAQAATAEPMKCSGEEKTCSTSCRKAARIAVSTCLTDCGTRLSACMRTGCWDNGVSRYCGLAKS